MSSFLQNTPVKFENYTPSYDIGLLNQVGQYKQNAYNQGVAQAQASIDNVAGLPVARDIDKQYLQQKLQAISTKANELQGKDFSDQRIVGQITSTAAAIANDSVLQNAVSSSMRVKQLYASQKEMRDKHPEKYTSSAENYDNSILQSYLSNPTVGASYNGPTNASVHTDYDEPIRKAIKDISPSIEYKVDATGKFTYSYDKNTKITPAQIQNVVNGVIATNPEFQKSIMMDAMYTYKNADENAIRQHIAGNAKEQNDNLLLINRAYQANIDKDPNNAAQVDYYKSAIADNLNTITENKNYQNRYEGYFKQGQSLDAIKQTLYSDNLRNTYSINFQKDIHDKEIKENLEVTKALDYDFKNKDFALKEDRHWLDYVEAGIDPSTKKALVPGDDLYVISRKAKSAKDGEENVEQNITQTGNSADILSVDKINDYQKTINTELKSIDDKYASAYLNAHEFPRTPENLAKAASFFKEQKEKVDRGETPDPIYSSYRQEIQTKDNRYNALQSLYKSVAEEGNRQFPINKTNTAINVPIKYQGADGNTYNNMYIDLDRGTSTVSAITSVFDKAKKQMDAVQADKYQQTKLQTGDEGVAASTEGLSGQQRTDILLGALEASKSTMNNADYTRVKALINKGFSTFSEVNNKIHAKIGEQVKKQNDYIETTLKAHTINYNTNAKVFPLEGAEQKSSAGIAYSLFLEKTRKDSKTSDGVVAEPDVKAEDVIANRVYNDINGIPHMVYTVKGKTYDDEIPTDNNVIGKPDPDLYIKNTIELSPYKNSGELTTTNQKVRYKISKNIATNNYDLIILDGNHPYNIPVVDPKTGQRLTNPTPSSIIQTIEAASRLSLTPQQIIDAAKASTKLF